MEVIVESRRPMSEAAMRYAELAIRSLLLVAGGAAIALAGFAGHSLGSGNPVILQALGSSVVWFAYSAAGAVEVAGLSYVAQILYHEMPAPCDDRLGGSVRFLAAALFVASLFCFVWGANAASLALTAPTTQQRCLRNST
jgi:hypothetical protein